MWVNSCAESTRRQQPFVHSVGSGTKELCCWVASAVTAIRKGWNMASVLGQVQLQSYIRAGTGPLFWDMPRLSFSQRLILCSFRWEASEHFISLHYLHQSFENACIIHSCKAQCILKHANVVTYGVLGYLGRSSLATGQGFATSERLA